MVEDSETSLCDQLSSLKIKDTKNESAITVQKNIRGYLIRRDLLKLKDEMDIDYLIKYIDGYNKVSEVRSYINPNLMNKKIRKINYPSEITENIAKFAIAKKYKVMPNWDTKPGDLKMLSKQLEVKGGFIENGPPTFGPTEKWDWIYFVDCNRTLSMNFKVYEIKMSNIHFHKLNVNKSEKFGDHCNQGRRPRIVFRSIVEQIGMNNCKLIFDGHITELI